MRISDWSSDVCSSDLVEVVAETAARQPRTRYPDLEQIADRRRRADDAVGLIVTAIGRAQLDLDRVGQPLGHVFDRAADRVAAVERAQIGRASCRERVCQYV